MGHRSKSKDRCERCRMHQDRCICEHIPRLRLATRLALVMHYREEVKTTATGPLALAALTNSEKYLHGSRGSPLSLEHLHEEGRRVLVLFPSEHARPLSPELKLEDPRPITLVVPDGNWRQASRVPKRVPGLERAEAVTLPPGPPTRWGLRRETKAAGLATFEAIARAFGQLESKEVQSELEELFFRMVEVTYSSRGYDKDGTPNQDEILTEGKLVPLSIIYRDESLVAIDKPSGLLVHRGWGKDEDPAVDRLREQLGRQVYPIHRLDRATSGVLLFALSSEVARDMQALFKSELIAKRYLAVCRGCSENFGRVDHALAKEKGEPRRRALTDFRLLGQFERYGLYEARPRTGRTHQIRRHLKHVSHPIVGDVRYGKGEHNRIFRDRFKFHRLALHCHQMEFPHPRGGQTIKIVAQPQGDFLDLLHRLGVASAIGAND